MTIVRDYAVKVLLSPEISGSWMCDLQKRQRKAAAFVQDRVEKQPDSCGQTGKISFQRDHFLPAAGPQTLLYADPAWGGLRCSHTQAQQASADAGLLHEGG